MSEFRRRFLHTSKKNILMTSKSNPEVMQICYAQGWASNPNYMTYEEAAAVTNTSAFNSAFNNSDILYFNEAKYFTGITGTISFTAPRLKEFAFLPNADRYNIGGKFPVCYRYDIGVCTKLSFKNGVETILNPYIAEIVVSPNNTIWAVTNGHLGQGQILYNKNNSSILWTTPDYKGGVIIYPLKYQQTNRVSVSYSYARFRGHTIVANNFYSGNVSFNDGGYYVQKIISFKNTSYYNSSSFPSNIGSRVPKSIVKEFIVSADNPKDFMADTNYTTNFLNPDVCNFQLKRVNFGITIYNEKALFPLKGLYADEYFMTKEECASVTSLGGRFRGSIVEDFNEFQYFTGLTRTEEYEFINSNLTSIILPSTITEIGDYSFAGCTKLTSITIPEGVTKIGDNTFEGCANLTSIILPSTITEIGSNAFKNCSLLTTITIPENVTYIGDYAFSGCSQLDSIVFKSINAPTFGENVFENIANNGTCAIPKNSVGYDNIIAILEGKGWIIRTGYIRKSYLESDNTNGQYIDTERLINSTDIIELTIEIIPNANNAKASFGWRWTGDATTGNHCYINTYSNYYVLGYGNNAINSTHHPLVKSHIVINPNTKTVMINDEVYLDESTADFTKPYNNGNSAVPLLLFTANNKGTPFSGSSCRIYEYKLSDKDGNVLQHLVPALDEFFKPCMVDLVINKKYYDKRGKGDFKYA